MEKLPESNYLPRDIINLNHDEECSVDGMDISTPLSTSLLNLGNDILEHPSSATSLDDRANSWKKTVLICVGTIPAIVLILMYIPQEITRFAIDTIECVVLNNTMNMYQ